MAFWVFMLIMGLLIPLTMVGFGKLFLTRAPKNINMVFGYRTVMSMKNRDTWEFAHKMLPMLGTLFPVEAALKKNFDKNGVRRQIGL